MAGRGAELVWPLGGSALLSPCLVYAPGALLAQAQIRELHPLPLGRGSWLVSPSSVPPSLVPAAGDTDACLWVVMLKWASCPWAPHGLTSRHCFPRPE